MFACVFKSSFYFKFVCVCVSERKRESNCFWMAALSLRNDTLSPEQRINCAGAGIKKLWADAD